MAYVTRTYRRRRGAGPGPMTGPVAWTGIFDGYQVYVFPHEHGHFSVVVIRPTADADLTLLRHVDAFDAACRAIPGLADWTDPALAAPTSGVMVGGRLRNVYRPQLGRPGLVAVGDSVATTAPTAGRGVAMASMQIDGLLHLLDGGADPTTIAAPFGAWCDRWIRPWVRGPPRHRRRGGALVAGCRHRPHPTVDVGRHRRRRRGGHAHRAAPRRLPRDDGAPRVPGTGRAAGPGRLRVRLATARERRTDPRRSWSTSSKPQSQAHQPKRMRPRTSARDGQRRAPQRRSGSAQWRRLPTRSCPLRTPSVAQSSSMAGLILVVASEPGQIAFVTAERRSVEPLPHRPECVEAPRVCRVGVVDDAVVKGERTHPWLFAGPLAPRNVLTLEPGLVFVVVLDRRDLTRRSSRGSRS